ncbi:MAG TPA: hypothetical protein VND88_07375 [Candidatus Acidoferrales bacterium]|nr:hypothetical protein [Candidatus Acidoferrales bacterium]
MTSTGTAPDVFGAAFLARAVEAVAATTIALGAGTARDLLVHDKVLVIAAVLVLFAIRVKRRLRRRDPDVDVADSYSLDADMVPV